MYFRLLLSEINVDSQLHFHKKCFYFLAIIKSLSSRRDESKSPLCFKQQRGYRKYHSVGMVNRPTHSTGEINQR